MVYGQFPSSSESPELVERLPLALAPATLAGVPNPSEASPVSGTMMSRGSVGLAGSSALLTDKLEALRRRHLTVLLLTGLAMAVVIGLELLALAMFVDWWLELPW